MRTVTQDTATQITLKNCSGEAWFSIQFYILSEQRISNKSSGIHSFNLKKKADQHLHSKLVWSWHLGRESYHQRSSSIGVLGREALNFYGHFKLLVTIPFSFMAKQIYNIRLIGHKQHKVQVKSSWSQNDRPIPQYVKITSIRILKGVASRGKTDFFFPHKKRRENNQTSIRQVKITCPQITYNLQNCEIIPI